MTGLEPAMAPPHGQARTWPVLWVLGVPVVKADPESALRAIESAFESARSGGPPALLAYVNAHTLNLAAEDPDYRDLLCRAALVLNDGAGLALAARLQGDRFPANLNGSDFSPALLELAARRGWRVFLLGGRPGVAEEATRRLQARIGGLQIVGARDGYFPPGRDAEVAAEVRAAGADLMMVAMGNPLQERWLEAHLEATGARLGIGVGAFLDFASGRVARAPAWLNRLGIEWVWRLAREPRRMWRRYILGNPLFLWRVCRGPRPIEPATPGPNRTGLCPEGSADR
ncbi:WecB/TagA/CpsF family glycosyltransferase [soil metagenome]